MFEKFSSSQHLLWIKKFRIPQIVLREFYWREKRILSSSLLYWQKKTRNTEKDYLATATTIFFWSTCIKIIINQRKRGEEKKSNSQKYISFKWKGHYTQPFRFFYCPMRSFQQFVDKIIQFLVLIKLICEHHIIKGLIWLWSSKDRKIKMRIKCSTFFLRK